MCKCGKELKQGEKCAFCSCRKCAYCFKLLADYADEQKHMKEQHRPQYEYLYG